jgi:hypothetical protein
MRLPGLATLLIVAALVMPAAHVATASDTSTVGPVYPWTQEWQEFTVNAGDTVLLGARWGACTSGLAWSARKALSYDYSFDGEPLAIDFLWDRPVVQAIGPGWDEPCIAGPNDGQSWWIYAEYPIVFEETGVYEVGVAISSSRPLIDGGDYDGDGKIDRVPVGVISESSSTVHVIAP